VLDLSKALVQEECYVEGQCHVLQHTQLHHFQVTVAAVVAHVLGQEEAKQGTAGWARHRSLVPVNTHRGSREYNI
jgi:hypothetical protein